MASSANIMKLLQTLGGASDAYSQGSMMRKGGQPLLPKPELSMPDNLSPYAPGNQGGGVHAHKGGYTNGPNRTKGAKPNQMPDSSDNHPANQLAQYLATSGGRSMPTGTDAAMYMRGAGMSHGAP